MFVIILRLVIDYAGEEQKTVYRFKGGVINSVIVFCLKKIVKI